MKINLQVKECHFSVTDDNNEVGLVYSLKDVDMEADALVLIRAFKGVMTQIAKLADDDESDSIVAGLRQCKEKRRAQDEEIAQRRAVVTA